MVFPFKFLLGVLLLIPRQSKTFIDTMAPVLAKTFGTLDDTGLCSSVEILAVSALILFFGKANEIFPSKWVPLSVLPLFLVGETICGTASSAPTFVAGRAVTGLWFAGVFVTIMMIIVDVFPLRRQTFIVGSLAAAFTVRTILGPFFGGIIISQDLISMVFLSYYPHRCCVSACHLFHSAIPPKTGPGHGRPKCPAKERTQAETSITGPAWKFDAVACLRLALSWGGFVYQWNSGHIIVLLRFSAVLTLAFVATQVYLRTTAMVPGYILKNRNILSGVLHSAYIAGAMTAAAFYIPLWFQVVRGVSAEKSRVHTLPMVLATTVSAGLTGVCVEKLGYYTPFIFWGALIEAVGAGFLSTTSTNTSSRTFAGFQILFGIGAGISLQQLLVAVQFVLPKEDIQKAQHPSC